MRLLFWRPSKAEDLRRAANVIADAVQAAKDEKIAAAEAALAVASQRSEESRVGLNLVAHGVREIRRALAEIPIEDGIETIGRDLGKRT